MQLTKEPLIKGFKLTLETVRIMNLVIANLKVDKENCQKAYTEEIYSVKKAFDLVKKGTPYREAYQKISKNL